MGEEMSWSTWYRLAREYADNRYGLRRVPVDTWKEYWATGYRYETAARAINAAKVSREEYGDFGTTEAK